MVTLVCKVFQILEGNSLTILTSFQHLSDFILAANFSQGQHLPTKIVIGLKSCTFVWLNQAFQLKQSFKFNLLMMFPLRHDYLLVTLPSSICTKRLIARSLFCSNVVSLFRIIQTLKTNEWVKDQGHFEKAMCIGSCKDGS